MIKDLIPDKTDSFFGLCYRQQLKDFDSPGPYLEKEKYRWTPLDSVTGKVLYKSCVKAINKTKW